ncbi:MAG TPA: hypothetical protein VGX94_04380 [Terriglobia bacterium]|nr:hypothetical protein [Terriglobia bacterium]
MLNEDQYMERTPDIVAKVRTMRDAAQKEMNRFTRVADYDVRRVVGHGPTPEPASVKAVSPPPVGDRTKKRATPPQSAQTSIEFAPLPVERADTGEDA